MGITIEPVFHSIVVRSKRYYMLLGVIGTGLAWGTQMSFANDDDISSDSTERQRHLSNFL